MKVGLRSAVTACAGAVALAGAGTALFAVQASVRETADARATAGVPYTCRVDLPETPTPDDPATDIRRTFEITLVGPEGVITPGQPVPLSWSVNPTVVPLLLEEAIDPGRLTLRGRLRLLEEPLPAASPTATTTSPTATATGTETGDPGEDPGDGDEADRAASSATPTGGEDRENAFADSPTPSATATVDAVGETAYPLPASSRLDLPTMGASVTPTSRVILEIQTDEFTLEATRAPASPPVAPTTTGPEPPTTTAPETATTPPEGETPETETTSPAPEEASTSVSPQPPVTIPLRDDGFARLTCRPADDATPAAIRITVDAPPPGDDPTHTASTTPATTPPTTTPATTPPATASTTPAPTPVGTHTRTSFATVTVPGTPRPTRTEFVTETAQVRTTPKGWARTGAATEDDSAAGALILGGAVMVLGAALGGLRLRRRAARHATTNHEP